MKKPSRYRNPSSSKVLRAILKELRTEDLQPRTNRIHRRTGIAATSILEAWHSMRGQGLIKVNIRIRWPVKREIIEYEEQTIEGEI